MRRRLYRSRRDSILGGVAGGVADYLDVDPSIVRIVWAVLALLTGGLFLVLYIVMWIVVPQDPGTTRGPVTGPAPEAVPGASPGQPAADPGGQHATDAPAGGDAAPAWQGWVDERRVRRGGSGGAVIFGLILIGVGIWFLIDRYVPAFDRDLVWPIALVVLGATLLVVSLRRPPAE